MSERRMRVLMLASYFPKPLNQLMGNWALAQAQALRRNGIDLKVVSLTSWVPRVLAVTRGARAYAYCPELHNWDALPVHYPRWLYYTAGPQRTLNERYPKIGLNIGWLTAKAKLFEVVNSFCPQMVYAHHTAVNGYVAAQLKRLHGLPFAVTDHDFGEIESCRRWPGRRRLFDSVTKQSSAMIAVSKRMEQEMRDQFPSARVCTIPNGAEPVCRATLENPRPAELRGKLIVFSCGTFYHRKAFPLLIDAFAQIAGKYPTAQLRIAGDGEERAEIEQRIRHHRLDSRVILLSAQPHERVIQEMVWCDVFALIGWDEPFATVYLEALAAARPLVCCSDGGITDVVRHGRDGYTVPPRDVPAAAEALDRLLGDEALRRRLGRAALDLYQTSLTWDRHAQCMKNLFTEALQESISDPQ